MGSCCIPFRMSRLPGSGVYSRWKLHSFLSLRARSLGALPTYFLSLHSKPSQNNSVPYCSTLCTVEVRSSWPSMNLYDSKASNTRWWPIASSFSLTDVQATSETLAEPTWLVYWNDTLVLAISLETLNIVQTVTPAQRKKGKKMVNTLKLELCNLI